MTDLAGFSLEKPVFHGSKSMVYRGRRTDGASVIIKVSANEFPQLEEIGRYRREFELGSLFNHPNIIQYLGLEKWGHGLAIIEEDVGAFTLRELMTDGGMEVELFLRAAMGAACGLEAIHRKRVMHRDINPQNLVWDPESQTLKFIDFGLASPLGEEMQEAVNPERLEGTLLYISPEQTGRMNRAVDYRSDFYSLGVTFYEMLCGKPPFNMTEALELVHAHIARQPTPPHHVRPSLPRVFSSIVMKLMAKNAEDRYQSAHGLKADLERCWEQVKAGRVIEEFEPGSEDIPEQLRISGSLYGRERELNILTDVFSRIGEGHKEMLLVAGYSGVGKSSLVRELQKPVTEQMGYYIAGKFDQYRRNSPYSAVIQAFRGLCAGILTEPEARLARWRSRLREQVGLGLSRLLDLIPEVGQITGDENKDHLVESDGAGGGFHAIFQNFIKVFTDKEHPLVLFLDDLQWADRPSLELLEALGRDPESVFLFIGAYRDHEVEDGHPLLLTLECLEKHEVRVRRLKLQPLLERHLQQLLADTLHTTSAEVELLASLIAKKTGGNPFFVSTFVKRLHESGLLIFDLNERRWTWDIDQIQDQAITDNVVDLMLDKLRELPEEAQELLQAGACLGDGFTLDILSRLKGKGWGEILGLLWPALREGLVHAGGTNAAWFRQADPGVALPEKVAATPLRFLHDRVQQASYALVAEAGRAALHLEIGRLLFRNLTPETLEEQLFSVLDQLNQGRALITNEGERLELSKLNLRAGEKAQRSAAISTASTLYKVAVGLLPDQAWDIHHPLVFKLHEKLAFCEHLLFRWESAEALYRLLLEHAADDEEKAGVLVTRMHQKPWHTEWTAMETEFREALSYCGMKLPQGVPEFKEALEREQVKLSQWVDEVDWEQMLSRKMEDPKLCHGASLLSLAATKGYTTGDNLLHAFCVLKSLNLFHRHGAPDTSYRQIVSYAQMTLLEGRYEDAFKLGAVGLEIAGKLPQSGFTSGVYGDLAATVLIYGSPFSQTIPLFDKGAALATELGHPAGIITSLGNKAFYLFARGDELDGFWDYNERLEELAHQKNFPACLDICLGYRQLVLILKGKGEPDFLTRKSFGDEAWDRIHSSNIRAQIHHQRLQADFWFRSTVRAKATAEEVEPLMYLVNGYIHQVEHYFLHALILARSQAESPLPETLEKLDAHLEKLKIYKKACPENFAHKHALAEAERARALKVDMETVCDLYNIAIKEAADNGFIQYEGLANRRFGEFWLERKMEKIARTYLMEARYLFQRWGADGLVMALDRQHEQLLYGAAPTAEPGSESVVYAETIRSSASRSDGASLDMEAVLKATCAISSEIDLEKLLGMIMRTMLDSAGARRGMLILEKDGALFVQAELDNRRVEVMQELPLEHCDRLSEAVVRYVFRTGKSAVLPDQEKNEIFARDSYLEQYGSCSILCTPIQYKERVLGVLYLENNLSLKAFSEERIGVLHILLTQAAISLENARLYQGTLELNRTLKGVNKALTEEMEVRKRVEREIRELNEALEVRVKERTAALEEAQKELVEKAHLAGMADIATSVLHNVGNVLNSVITSSQLIDTTLGGSKVHSLGKANATLTDMIQKNFPDPACREQRLLSYYNLLQGLLVEDQDLIKNNIDRIIHKVEIIRNVIMSQQKYVAQESHTETFFLDQVVMDALAILESHLGREGVQVIRNSRTNPEVQAQKAKLVHVLMNLIRNAVTAMRDKESEDKVLTLSVGVEQSSAFVTVTDQGEGIEADHISLVFTHGFSTWSDNGFGLHSCANAMAEMGGTIKVESPGKGLGACFTLEIPLKSS